MDMNISASAENSTLEAFLPKSYSSIQDLDTSIPTLSKDTTAITAIEDAVRRIPTSHKLLLCDARDPFQIAPESVHLVVTSPPYWTLKRYRETQGQLGHVADYDNFLDSLDMVWQWILKALVPGGRLICVVGDVCLSRRNDNGEHTCVPLHSSIQERCRKLGFSNWTRFPQRPIGEFHLLRCFLCRGLRRQRSGGGLRQPGGGQSQPGSQEITARRLRIHTDSFLPLAIIASNRPQMGAVYLIFGNSGFVVGESGWRPGEGHQRPCPEKVKSLGLVRLVAVPTLSGVSGGLHRDSTVQPPRAPA